MAQGEMMILIEGGIYRVQSRNLAIAVYDGKGGFTGIREKFGSYFLFTEFDWITGPPFGTVKPQEMVAQLLPGVSKRITLGYRCARCGTEAWLLAGGTGWTCGGGCDPPDAKSVPNDALFWLLREIEGDDREEREARRLEDRARLRELARKWGTR